MKIASAGPGEMRENRSLEGFSKAALRVSAPDGEGHRFISEKRRGGRLAPTPADVAGRFKAEGA